MSDPQPPRKRRRLRVPFLLAAIGTWAFLLRGFVSTPGLIVLSVIGPALARGGLYLTVASARHMLTSARYLGAFVAGLLLLGGAGLTLAPQAPGRFLATTASGWARLEDRTRRLDEAIENGDLGLARRLANRGLGDPGPLGAFGRPLIHDVKDATLLAALLESGLDPDARDPDGRTLLMNTRDVGIARTLLAGGADPNARQRGGYTVLMGSTDKEPEMIELLLGAGADVHAVDEAGRSVADFFSSGGPVWELLESRAAGRPLQKSGDPDLWTRGRTDWLVVERNPSAHLGASAVTLDRHPPRYGEVVTLDIRLTNRLEEDRLLDVTADLNSAALFVDASHDGSIRDPRQIQSQQTMRWPALALPRHSQGRLQLRIVTRSDENAGDLMVDVRVGDSPGPEKEVLQVHESLARGPQLAPAASGGWIVPVLIPGAVLLWVLLRRGLGSWRPAARAAPARVARPVAGLAAVACGGMALLLIWSMIQPFFGFEEATCTVLDRRALTRTARSSGRSGRPSTYAVPIVAVRVDNGAEPVIATGFATDFGTRSVAELRWFPPGATVPCWVDPEDPSLFTLVRHPAIARLLGIGSLAALALVLGAVARRLE